VVCQRGPNGARLRPLRPCGFKIASSVFLARAPSPPALPALPACRQAAGRR